MPLACASCGCDFRATSDTSTTRKRVVIRRNVDWAPSGQRTNARCGRTFPDEWGALSWRPKNARADTVGDKVDRFHEQLIAGNNLRNCIRSGKSPSFNGVIDGGNHRRPRPRFSHGTIRSLTRLLRCPATRSVDQGPISTRELVRREMDQGNGITAVVKVVTARRLRGARCQHQTGKDHHEGDSPVLQQP
jgi:hypothetical protein